MTNPLEDSTNPEPFGKPFDDPAAENAQPAAPGLPEDVRATILRRFEAWLDRTLAGGAPLEGLDAELLAELAREDEPAAEAAPAGYDLYSLWSALTALREETRIQGRHFKQLSETLEPLASVGAAVDEALAAHGEALAEARRLGTQALGARGEREHELRREAQRQAVLLMIDTRDRLERGLASARAALDATLAPVRGHFDFLRRMGSDVARNAADAARALRQGYELTLESLTEGLEQLGVRPIHCLGELFDPRWMNAADLAETTVAPEGTVLEVYRNGYTWNGEPLRPAQVKVARAPSAGG